MLNSCYRQESNIIFRGAIIRACNLAYMIVSTSLIMWLVLTVHTSVGGDLSTRQVFTLLSLLTSLRLSAYFFVLALLGFSEGRVAVHRIQVCLLWRAASHDSVLLKVMISYFALNSLQQFLSHEDIVSSGSNFTDFSSKSISKRLNGTTIYPAPNTTQKIRLSSNYYTDSIFIKVENLSASWSCNSAKLVLQEMNFEVNEVRT